MSAPVPPSPLYLSGFGSHFSTEALPGALPQGQNSPQTCPYGLYAEQLSGTAFTVPRSNNLRSWLYRIHPSVGHGHFKKVSSGFTGGNANQVIDPSPLRWNPFDVPQKGTVTFIEGIKTLTTCGDPKLKHGLNIHIYASNANMEKSAFYNADGDFLIVPELGSLDVKTELGKLYVSPKEIIVIPRGIKFSVNLPDGPSRGYILEVFDGHFEIPDLGPIGSNGLANPRDFKYPVAHYDECAESVFKIYNKYANELFVAEQNFCPFDVVAWHGNYAPFKYNLALFNAMNTVTFDHADPSIFTVLTCKSLAAGVAIADFVIFPPRWAVADHTFRPPYYHRNIMSEFMGNLCGVYEAKKEGFLPGGASLHTIMTPHGPDLSTFEGASSAELKPVRVADGGLQFMFESSLVLSPTVWAMKECGKLQDNYWTVWADLKRHFNPQKP